MHGAGFGRRVGGKAASGSLLIKMYENLDSGSSPRYLTLGEETKKVLLAFGSALKRESFHT